MRIPASRGLGTRVEVRCPDPACNPYLAFSMMLNCGLDGIKNKLQAPPSVDVNIFDMTPAEKEAANIDNMPASLEEALEAFKANPISRETLGDHIYDKYVTYKQEEWDRYRTAVTDWELEEYLSIY
jgi:glutamine synthetase